mmetsp:Transcript_46623/g.77087  ORF Transcript_46623/g.77087 Transcript_46623/m.77087 type:complete len:243 (+) Transcript_46623:440-1168(+)
MLHMAERVRNLDLDHAPALRLRQRQHLPIGTKPNRVGFVAIGSHQEAVVGVGVVALVAIPFQGKLDLRCGFSGVAAVGPRPALGEGKARREYVHDARILECFEILVCLNPRPLCHLRVFAKRPSKSIDHHGVPLLLSKIQRRLAIFVSHVSLRASVQKSLHILQLAKKRRHVDRRGGAALVPRQTCKVHVRSRSNERLKYRHVALPRRTMDGTFAGKIFGVDVGRLREDRHDDGVLAANAGR